MLEFAKELSAAKSLAEIARIQQLHGIGKNRAAVKETGLMAIFDNNGKNRSLEEDLQEQASRLANGESGSRKTGGRRHSEVVSLGAGLEQICEPDRIFEKGDFFGGLSLQATPQRLKKQYSFDD